jgi:TP901 family phage tail tape measure protein
MAERSYRVRLDASVAGFVAGFKQAERSVDQFLTKADKASKHLDTIGNGATKVGVVAAAGLGLAAKAAIDWESAWAGVTKTVDGSTTQMAALEGQLRGMAKTLPASHQEIAAVAEAAGQLGVKRDDIASFTKVMVDLGQTTNLSADEASTSLAQFMNVMGTAPANVGRLGASIVALGNDGASTERDIVAMAQRISGSGKIIGMSETQVLAYAAALANVGIEAEAGGSAISMIFTKIDKSVSEGGQSLTDFATVSGMTADQFKQKFQTDASGATQMFIEGLGRINAAGGDVNGTLEALGITEIRQRDAVLRLAASGTNLADSLKVSGDGWRDNTALVDEAAKRYATTESQIKISWNGIKDSAITAGTAMLPVIAQIAEQISNLAGFFGGLPAPVQKSAVALLAVVAAGGLVTGGVLKMVTSLAAAKTAMVGLGASSKTASVAMGTLGRAGVAGVAIAGVIGITNAINDFKAATSQADVSKLAGDLIRFGATGKSTGELMKNFGSDFSGVSGKLGEDGIALGQALTTVANSSDSTVSRLTELSGRIPQFGLSFGNLTHPLAAFDDSASQMRDRVGELDSALGALVDGGNPEAATAAFDGLVKQSQDYAQAAGEPIPSIDALMAKFPEYASAIQAAGVDTEIAGDKTAAAKGPVDSLGNSFGVTGDKAQTAADKLKNYIDALFLMPNLVLGVRDAQRGVQAAMDDATASIKENGKTLNIGTEKGRANQAAIDAIAASANKLSEAYLNNNSSQKQITDGAVAARAAYVQLAHKMGMPIPVAKALAEQIIKIPNKADIQLTNNAPAAKAKVKPYADILNQMNQTFTSTLKNNASGAPLTAAQRYDQQLRGTLPQVKTAVTNTADSCRRRSRSRSTRTRT